jgi:hypothetical protein
MGQAEQDGTDRTGQDRQYRKGKIGHAELDRQNRTLLIRIANFLL